MLALQVSSCCSEPLKSRWSSTAARLRRSLGTRKPSTRCFLGLSSDRVSSSSHCHYHRGDCSSWSSSPAPSALTLGTMVTFPTAALTPSSFLPLLQLSLPRCPLPIPDKFCQQLTTACRKGSHCYFNIVANSCHVDIDTTLSTPYKASVRFATLQSIRHDSHIIPTTPNWSENFSGST